MPDDALDTILRDVLDVIPDGVFVTGPDLEIVYWNEAASRITGYAAEDVLGARCCDVLADRDAGGASICGERCFLTRAMETGVRQDAGEVYLLRGDGQRLGVVAQTRRLTAGDAVYGVEIFREAAAVGGRDVASAIQQISDVSVIDSLTGLLNRDYVDAMLEQQFALFRRVGLHFALTRIDIDDMKSVNADFGRPTGDELLRFVAAVLADNTRKMDTLARLGSDEFLIVSPVRAAAGAEEIGRRALELIRGSAFTSAGEEIVPLRVSVGGAVVRTDDPSEVETLARADAALREVRTEGGDGFRFAH